MMATHVHVQVVLSRTMAYAMFATHQTVLNATSTNAYDADPDIFSKMTSAKSVLPTAKPAPPLLYASNAINSTFSPNPSAFS
jgi:hypothetical protein